jgi:DNA gyrase subunit B
MYLGNITDGLRMIWELLANSLDQHLAGHCHSISIEIREDGGIAVEDDGQGFPVHPIDDGPFAEHAFTSLHRTPTLDGHAHISTLASTALEWW